MTAAGWRDVIQEAMDRLERGDPKLIDLLSVLLAEQDQAKDDLRRLGYGCLGMPWPKVVQAIADAEREA